MKERYKKMVETRMNNGSYRHTEDWKKNQRECAKNNSNYGMGGKHHSEEAKHKVSEARRLRREKLGYLNSEETRKKMGIRMNGNKFNLGRTQSKETIQKRIKSRKWYKHSKETRLKIGRIHKGKKISEETKQKIREARAKQITPKKDTTIEVKIQNYLKQLNIEFFTHQYMNIKHGYQCDIFIPSMNLVIECDGDYWHKYPIGREIDNIRTSELLEKGFKVLRLWEIDIRKMNIKEFKERIKWM